jgi:outer membrane receptor protein involved in Fe transport
LGINAGYLNAKYENFSSTGNPVVADFNYSGQTMTNAPEVQLSMNAALDQPLNDKVHLVGNITESYISRIIFADTAEPGTLGNAEQSPYWITNLRVGLKTSDGKYGIALYANNLFNQGYITQGSSSALGNSLVWGSPRVIGGEITAHF